MSIGERKEKGIHRHIKCHIQENPEQQEVPLCGHIIDAITADGVLHEVQSRNFYSIKKKIVHLLEEGYEVDVVFPVANQKYIQWVDLDGTLLDRRKSPKKGQRIHVFTELYSFSDWILTHPNFRCTTYEMDTIEYKAQDGIGKNNRNRATKLEQEVISINNIRTFRSCSQYCDFFHEVSLDSFSVLDFGTYLKLKKGDSQKILKTLHRLGLICREKVGKQFIYKNPKSENNTL